MSKMQEHIFDDQLNYFEAIKNGTVVPFFVANNFWLSRLLLSNTVHVTAT